ncbi:hypothetical protein O0L34_g12931 [Tuta absoluta]|nr:hypothetical protein O0L34_g12931 [Tuta absoluta]
MAATHKFRKLYDVKRSAFHQDYSMMSLPYCGTARVPIRIFNNPNHKPRGHYDPRDLHRMKSFTSSIFLALQDKIINYVTSTKTNPTSRKQYNVKSREEKKAMSFIELSLTSPEKPIERKITTAAKFDPPKENKGSPKVITLSSASKMAQMNVATFSTSLDELETKETSLFKRSEPSKRKFAPVPTPIIPLKKMDIRNISPDPKQNKDMSPSTRSEKRQLKVASLANIKKNTQANPVAGTEAIMTPVYIGNESESPSASTETIAEEKSNTSVEKSDVSSKNLCQTYQGYNDGCSYDMPNKIELNTSIGNSDMPNNYLSQTYQGYNGGYSYGYSMPNANESTSATMLKNAEAKSNTSKDKLDMSGQNLSKTYQGYYGRCAYGYGMLPAQMIPYVQTTSNFNMPIPIFSQAYQNYNSGYGYNYSTPPVAPPYQMVSYAQMRTQPIMANPNLYQAYQSYNGRSGESFIIPTAQKTSDSGAHTKDNSDMLNSNLSQACQSLRVCGCCDMPFCGYGSCCGCGGCQNYFSPYCNTCGPCGCGSYGSSCGPYPCCYQPGVPGCGVYGCGPCGPTCTPCGPNCGVCDPCGNICGPCGPTCTPCGPNCGVCDPCGNICGPCGPQAPCGPCAPCFPAGRDKDWNPFTCPPPPLDPSCVEGYVPAAFGISLPKINMNVRIR